MDLTAQWIGVAAIAVFVLAYALVITEEYTSLRKSKAVILAAGIIWAMIGYRYSISSLPVFLSITLPILKLTDLTS